MSHITHYMSYCHITLFRGSIAYYIACYIAGYILIELSCYIVYYIACYITYYILNHETHAALTHGTCKIFENLFCLGSSSTSTATAAPSPAPALDLPGGRRSVQRVHFGQKKT